MFRARRYRVLIIFAAAFVLTFFHFARSRDWRNTVIEESIGRHPPDPAYQNPPSAPKADNPAAVAAIEENRNRLVADPNRGSSGPTPYTGEKSTSPVGSTSASKEGSRIKEGSHGPPPVKPPVKDTPKDDSKDTTKESTAKRPTTQDVGSTVAEEIDNGGAGRKPVERPDPSIPAAKWRKFPERFPVPAADVIKLPKEQSKTIPKLQARFKDESSADKQERLQHLSTIKAEFKHAWQGYKDVAMGHDEVKPLTKQSEDPFNGWGATLVDSLDTLWIMQLKDEFSEAMDVIKNIDFKTSMRADIPMFETTIRYLGGLIGAYDISGSRYPMLLDKAEELAEVLIGAFDTPNRMPHLYYRWAP